MVALRRLAFTAGVVVLVLLAAVFAYTNPEPIDVDVGFTRFERVPMAAAFAIALALGWLVGLMSAAAALWRAAAERRRLRHDLEYATAELRAKREAQ